MFRVVIVAVAMLFAGMAAAQEAGKVVRSVQIEKVERIFMVYSWRYILLVRSDERTLKIQHISSSDDPTFITDVPAGKPMYVIWRELDSGSRWEGNTKKLEFHIHEAGDVGTASTSGKTSPLLNVVQ